MNPHTKSYKCVQFIDLK